MPAERRVCLTGALLLVELGGADAGVDGQAGSRLGEGNEGGAAKRCAHTFIQRGRFVVLMLDLGPLPAQQSK